MLKMGTVIMLTFCLVLTPLVTSAADVKIGVVDADDIMEKSSEGKRVQESMKRKGEELQKPLITKRQELNREVEAFQKQASVMKEDAKKKKTEELERKMQEFERQAADIGKQISQYQEKELGPFMKKLEQAIEAVGREEKLDLVFQRRGVMVINKSMDITDKVRGKLGN